MNAYIEELIDTLTYLTMSEYKLMNKLASEYKSPIIVNIGAGAGTSGLTFREACPEAELYTIDIRPSGPYGGLEGERNAFDKANLEYPIQVLGDSKELNWETDIDILFIDGDHSKEGIRGDIENFLPHVNKGGVVIFHDYVNTKWSAVKPVVDELMAGHKIVGESDRIIAYEKSN